MPEKADANTADAHKSTNNDLGVSEKEEFANIASNTSSTQRKEKKRKRGKSSIDQRSSKRVVLHEENNTSEKRKNDNDSSSHTAKRTLNGDKQTNADHAKTEANRGKSRGNDDHPKRKDFNPGPGRKDSLKEKAKALFATRKGLPIFSHADEIRSHLRRTDVMLLVGETGSGKSTQIPQFLVDEKWCRAKIVAISPSSNSSSASTAESDVPKEKANMPVGGCIAITQPRRVAAVSLARRVADEMGTPLGASSPASKVGYSVRFDTSTSPSTKIKFLTEGMLLQEMLRDPWLTKYSAVVVDEVHERGVNVDLLLGFLRNMVSGVLKDGRGGVPLKVVVMSATADMERLAEFFQEGLTQGDKNEPTSSGTNVAPRSEQPMASKEVRNADSSEDQRENSISSKPGKPSREVATCHIKGRQYPVKVVYSPHPVPDFVDAALKCIFQIHMKEPLPGDILVFLTGQETVESLEQLVNEYATNMDPNLPKVLALPLFAALPQAAQQKVFLPAPPRTRKVVLATNIAETSVTVSGVRYVVDCGKAKMKQFRTRLGLDSLLVKPVSKSAAIQRKGRAGREAPGQCYRLYTETDYLALQEKNTPEILRCDLSQAILTMKARGVDNIMAFPFLTMPAREALEKALLQLFSIQALDDTGNITEMGLQIAKLPVTAQLGRVLLAAAEAGPRCLRDVVDIISCLSVENMFLGTSSEEKKEEAEKARRDLFRREGDHLTMLATVRAYAAENTDRKAWAQRHLVSHRAMQAVMVC